MLCMFIIGVHKHGMHADNLTTWQAWLRCDHYITESFTTSGVVSIAYMLFGLIGKDASVDACVHF